MKKNKTLFICYGAIIAAVYVVLTYVSSLFGLSSGVIQLRLSEALCILPVFTPAAIPGLYIGCLVSNLLTTGIVLDVLIGPVATLLGALGTYYLRKKSRWLSLAPPVIANALIIPFILSYGYGAEEAIPFMMLTVGIGELISVYVFGSILFTFVEKRKNVLFK